MVDAVAALSLAVLAGILIIMIFSLKMQRRMLDEQTSLHRDRIAIAEDANTQRLGALELLKAIKSEVTGKEAPAMPQAVMPLPETIRERRMSEPLRFPGEVRDDEPAGI